MCRAVIGSGVGISVNPGIAIAGSNHIRSCVAAVDGEVERYHRVTARSVGERMRSAVVGSIVSVAVNPGVIATGRDNIGAGIAAVDGEVERYHRIATSSIRERVCCAVVGSRVAVPINPRIAIAGSNDIRASVAVVDGEVKCYHRVATSRIGKRLLYVD